MFKEKYFNKNKERRKKYKGSKRFDCSCRNGGSCNYCYDNRSYNNNKKDKESKDKMNE